VASASRLATGSSYSEGFNAARPVEDREKYAEKINDLINKRQLPPAAWPLEICHPKRNDLFIETAMPLFHLAS
jgi:hypothetical protein